MPALCRHFLGFIMRRQFPVPFVFAGVSPAVYIVEFTAPDNLQLVEVSFTVNDVADLSIVHFSRNPVALVGEWFSGQVNAGTTVLTRKDFFKPFGVGAPVAGEYPIVPKGDTVQAFFERPLPPFLINPSLVLTFTAS